MNNNGNEIPKWLRIIIFIAAIAWLILELFHWHTMPANHYPFH